MYYLLIYDVIPDYVESRVPFRAEHLALAQSAHERGDRLLLSIRTSEMDWSRHGEFVPGML
jgi:hypothetical protein